MLGEVRGWGSEGLWQGRSVSGVRGKVKLGVKELGQERSVSGEAASERG